MSTDTYALEALLDFVENESVSYCNRVLEEQWSPGFYHTDPS